MHVTKMSPGICYLRVLVWKCLEDISDWLFPASDIGDLPTVFHGQVTAVAAVQHCRDVVMDQVSVAAPWLLQGHDIC